MTLVRTSNGAVRGSVEGSLHVFRGIPYAEPISGPARWLPPQPRRPWTDVRDASDYGDACQQFGAAAPGRVPRARWHYIDAIRGDLREGDDCLLLNVWTPSVDHNARLPVMVFIHGGGLTQGAAFDLYNAAPFAERGVVTVVIQYRLGPPGFLHGAGLFEGDLCADNRGLLDQLAALQWVQQNIAAFGGDASQVTIFGESAGAFSVYYLAASPLANGLFHRAIAMGGMTEACAPADDYHALTRDVLTDVGITPGDAQALAAAGNATVNAMQAAIRKRVFGKKAPGRYGAISRDKVSFVGAASGTAFLPEPPLQRYRSGTPNNIDLMLGTCAHDGRLFSLMLPLPMRLNAMLFTPVLRNLVPNRDLDAIRAYYRSAMTRNARVGLHEQINNDTFFRMPTIAAAEAHATTHPGRTYLYQVDYASAIAGLGAIHGIEVALLFGPSQAKKLLYDDHETQRLSALMLDAWTAFAKNGTPATAGLPHWPAYDTHERNTMLFDRQTRLQPDCGGELRAYWAGADRNKDKAMPIDALSTLDA